MAVHFVGFRNDRYNTAVKVFGKPDFVHRTWDVRAKFGGEIHPDDTVVFAKDDETAEPSKFSFDDSAHF